MLVLSGTAIAFKVVEAGNITVSDRLAQQYAQQTAQDGQAAPKRGGCGSGGCSTGAGRGGCGGGGAGVGCQGGGQGADTLQDPEVIAAIEKSVSDYYLEKFRDSDFTVEVKDLGCHQEAYIIKDGSPILTFSVSGNNISLIN